MMECKPHHGHALVSRPAGRSLQTSTRRLHVVWAVLYGIISIVYSAAASPLFHHHKEIEYSAELAMAVFWGWMCADETYRAVKGE